MRTTVSIDPDVAAAVERLRRDEGLGLSEALNRLARRGLSSEAGRAPYHLRPANLGVMIDVTNVAEVLDLLDD